MKRLIVALLFLSLPAFAQTTYNTVHTGANRPACDLAHRGLVWVVPGSSGVSDSVAVCEMAGSGSFAWVPIDSTGGFAIVFGHVFGPTVTLTNVNDIASVALISQPGCGAHVGAGLSGVLVAEVSTDSSNGTDGLWSPSLFTTLTGITSSTQTLTGGSLDIGVVVGSGTNWCRVRVITASSGSAPGTFMVGTSSVSSSAGGGGSGGTVAQGSSAGASAPWSVELSDGASFYTGAKDSTLTGGTQRTKITDGTNNAAVKPASTAAQATDPALVVSLSPNSPLSATVSNFPATQPVSAAALPLPSGAAQDSTLTGGAQRSKVTDGTNNAAVKAASTAAAATDPALVVAISPNNTVPISAASLPLPSGAATDRTTAASPFSIRISNGASFLDPTQIRLLTSSDTISTVQSGIWTVTGLGGTFPVTGTFWQATQPVSAASLPLPSGAAADSTLTGGTAKARITDGTNTAAVKAASTAALATDPAIVVAISPNNPITTSGTADAVSAGAPTTLTTNGQCTGNLAMTGEQSAGFQLNPGGTLVATLTPQYSLDPSGGNWTTTTFTSGPTISATNPNVLVQTGINLTVGGVRRVQVCVTSAPTGSGTAFAVATFAPVTASSGGGGGTVVQGNPGTNANSWWSQIGDTVNGPAAVKPASTAAVGTDKALVVAISPNNTLPVSAASLPLPAGAAQDSTLTGGTARSKVTDGTNNAAVKAASTPAATTDPALVVAISPNNTLPISAASLPLPSGAAQDSTLTGGTARSKVTDGTNNAAVKAASTAALTTDPALVVAISPNNTLPVSAAALPLPAGAAADSTLTGGTQRTKITDGTNNAAVKAASTAAVATDPAVVVAVSPNNTLPVSAASLPLPSGASQDSTLTGGTAKAVIRGGAKGSTSATDVTSTASGANHQALDVTLWDQAGSALDPRTRSWTLSSGTDSIATTQSGTWSNRLTDGTLNLSLLNAAPGSDTGQVSMPVRIISSLAGGGSGTSSNFGSAFPTPGTAAGCKVVSSTPTGTAGNMDPCTLTTADEVRVSITSAVTQNSQGLGTAGTPAGGYINVQADPTAAPIPMQTTGSTVLAANAANRTANAAAISTGCTTTTACAGTAALVLAMNGAQSATFTVTAITTPSGYTVPLDASYDNGTTYSPASCPMVRSDGTLTGTQKGATLANGDLVVGAQYTAKCDNSPGFLRIRNSNVSATGTFTVAGQAVMTPGYLATTGAAIANGMPSNAAGNAIGQAVMYEDSTTPTLGRRGRADANGELVSIEHPNGFTCIVDAASTSTQCVGLSGAGLSYYIKSVNFSASAAITIKVNSSTTAGNACATAPALVVPTSYMGANTGGSFPYPNGYKVTANSALCCQPSGASGSCTINGYIAP